MTTTSSACAIESSARARSETRSGSSPGGLEQINPVAVRIDLGLQRPGLRPQFVDLGLDHILALDAELPGDDAVAEVPLECEKPNRYRDVAPEGRTFETSGHG